MSNSLSETSVGLDPVRKEILTGARELFIHFGFKKTTMEDIAKKIGRSKSSLYYYFKTKEEIFEAMALEDMDFQHRNAVETMNREEAVQDRFRSFVVSLFTHLISNKQEYSVFKAELMENPFLIMNITEKRNAYMEVFLKDLVLYGIRRGEIRELSHEEIDIWAKAINVSLKGIGSRLFLGNDQEKFKDHLGFIADALFMGITTKI
ncbi:TetR/AcrR family transcriptional regulator [Flavihumibacter sp. CACIAM 22H1]|uniref:TetR/AcrR family transcriptional regulator n=1 Tax=Flavihumibacter sp. CACIAM 22H1 TaxID=1812911 RepID=UPI000A74EF0E|nr:TetR/AcrR family transcriptional regulator [Flavihumibacter sp. CACIAM 22H1]